MSWILTHSGAAFDPINPDPDLIEIEDIAHALSNMCRFNGHCRQFYSVAQHSLLVSHMLPEELKLVGLMHDATEAYIADITRPVKPHLMNYQAIEQRLWLAIAERFELPPVLPDEVHYCDLKALATEKRDLMPDHPEPWPVLEGILPNSVQISGMMPEKAKTAFLREFQCLTN